MISRDILSFQSGHGIIVGREGDRRVSNIGDSIIIDRTQELDARALAFHVRMLDAALHPDSATDIWEDTGNVYDSVLPAITVGQAVKYWSKGDSWTVYVLQSLPLQDTTPLLTVIHTGAISARETLEEALFDDIAQATINAIEAILSRTASRIAGDIE